MSIVRFATLCDRCGKRSEEYSGWPTCECCVEDVCPDCYRADTLDEEHNRVTCLVCHLEERQVGDGAL